MRSFLIPALTAAALAATAAPADAQADRYGGYAAYPAQAQAQQAQAQQIQAQQVQAQQAAPAQPSRVLTWPGKTIPAAPPAQPAPQAAAGPYGYPAPVAGNQLRPPPYGQAQYGQPYAQGRPAYPSIAPATYYTPPPRAYAPAPQRQPQPQQALQLHPAIGYAPPPQGQGRPYPAQPYYAAPAAPTPGSTATAPTGVYPGGATPPQLVYPMGAAPRMNGQLVGPQSEQNRQAPLPASIYAPPAPAPQASAQPNPTDPRQPQRVAVNTAAPAPSARLYSVHREFGLTPDPTPAAAPEGQTVELVSPIDSPAPNPDGEVDRPETRRVTDTSGKSTVVHTRGSSSGADD